MRARTDAQLECADEHRRADARAHDLNGIDSIDVSADQLHVSVLLFGKIPDGLTAANVRIDSAPEAPPVTVTAMRACPDHDDDRADCLELTVDRPGDWNVYTLCFVAIDAHGHPGTSPYPGFDARYHCASFSFKQNCPTTLDCAPACECVAPVAAIPDVDYLARDYSSLRSALLDRLSLTMPAWQEAHAADIGVTLVELLAYAGDLLNYELDAVATEAYIDTARLRTSVRRHARLVDYRMHEGCAARAFVHVEVSGDVTLAGNDCRFTAGTEIFECVETVDVQLYQSHNEIALWTWGDTKCCLAKGAMAATLVDDNLRLAAGDVVIFEEILGPYTGLATDADSSHRHAVRLTTTRHTTDPLYDQALLEVEWEREDALPFDLCVNARGGADCRDLVVGVARGNIILVEHGRSIEWCHTPPTALPWPEAPPLERGCPPCRDFGCCDDTPSDVLAGYPPRRRPITTSLPDGPVTRRAPFPDPCAIARAQARELRAVPERARERLDALSRLDRLVAADLTYLTTLFGAPALANYGVSTESPANVAKLLAHFDQSLAPKLERLTRLRRRAHSGYVLSADDEGHEVAETWGDDAGAALDPSRPLLHGPASLAQRGDPRHALPVVTLEIDGVDWQPVADLLECGPEDRCFVAEIDDDGIAAFRFGDGRLGAQPAFGATVTASYRVGNGTAGNVGAESISWYECCETKNAPITLVRNPMPACGGIDPEAVADVRALAPGASTRTLERAITADDYAAIAAQRPDVQNAAAQLRWTGSWYEAEVAIDADDTDTAPRWLLGDEREHLRRYRRIGHDLAVASARLVPIDLALCVRVVPSYITAHVEAAVLERLGDGVLPDGTLAYFHPDNLTFGAAVRISPILAAVAALPGVAGVVVASLQRMFGPADPGVLDAGVLVLRADEIAQLDNDPTRPDHGTLHLTMTGGR